MWFEDTEPCGYPFALDLFIDEYEGPPSFKKHLRRKTGWLKAVRVNLDTPIQSWSETLFACITDDGMTLSNFPASFLTAMQTSMPMEVEHVPPADDLDELIDAYYWDFLGRCDRYCQRILDQAHADADLVVEHYERELERLNGQIDAKLQVIRRLLRDFSRRADWPTLENKATRLKRMADQLTPIFQKKMRDARREVDKIEEQALASMGYDGELEELYTVYFRVRDRSESPRVLLRWQRSARTHQVPWEDERKTLVRELEGATSYVPNRGRQEPLYWNNDGKLSEANRPSKTKPPNKVGKNAGALITPEKAGEKSQAGKDVRIPSKAAAKPKKVIRYRETKYDADADFRRMLELDARRELRANAANKLAAARKRLSGPFSLIREADMLIVNTILSRSRENELSPLEFAGWRVDQNGLLIDPLTGASTLGAVEVDPLLIIYAEQLTKGRRQATAK